MPFSANRANAGIKCQTLEAKPLDDMSNTVQALHGAGAYTVEKSAVASSTPQPADLPAMVCLSPCLSYLL